MVVLAKWQSRGGKHFIELSLLNSGGYGYTGNGCGGCLGATITTDERAIEVMQARVESGMYLPDSAKLPMKRVI